MVRRCRQLSVQLWLERVERLAGGADGDVDIEFPYLLAHSPQLPSLLQQRKPTLSVADPVIRFNQLITVPSTELLERRLGQQVWDGASATFHSQILGPHFEELARDWARHYAQTEIGIDPGAVGTTDIHDVAGRAKHELDVVALAPGEKPRTQERAHRPARRGQGHRPPTWHVRSGPAGPPAHRPGG
jgi:hypothetical protein